MMSSALPLALAALLLSGSAAIARRLRRTPAPDAAQPPAPPEGAVVSLSAVFAGDPKPIRSGLVWRVFDDKGDAGQPAVVARSTEAAPNLSLPPGAYIVHAAYGFAGATKRLTVQGGAVAERLTISAGALKLSGGIGDAPIPPNRVSFSVFVPVGNNVEGRLLIRGNVKAGEIIRLPEGMYHVVSTYGESNAIMRADLKVDTGRVTEAALNHRAATLTLKLVAAAGGESVRGHGLQRAHPRRRRDPRGHRGLSVRDPRRRRLRGHRPSGRAGLYPRVPRRQRVRPRRGGSGDEQITCKNLRTP